MQTYTIVATTTFGLEAVVRRELQALGYEDITVSNGKVMFSGTLRDVVISNLWLRSADRVLIEIASFQATTFDQLFDQVRRIKWQDIVPKNGTVIVNASSVKSKLYSLRDIQKIGKKAISDKLMFAYKTDWLNEKGSRYSIKISILNNMVSVTLDTTGDGLHKRGYRIETVEAPLKETLAAALIQLSYWNKDRILYDVFCGSGTIPIEAAMIARNIAPGLNRDFDAKHWEEFLPNDLWKSETKRAYQAIDYDAPITIYASDISPENVGKAKENAVEAGVDDCIIFSVSDFQDVSYDTEYGIIISNPPYGERLMDEKQIIQLTQAMKRVFQPLTTWSVYLLTSFSEFESVYGKSSSRKRKLYNGRLETWYYQYYGPRPKEE